MASIDVIINTIDKGSQNIKSFFGDLGSAWKDLATPLNQTLELVDKLKTAGIEALEAFAEGAEANQVADSFDRLNESLGVTPGLLDRMREASRGTIDDTTLMAGSLTLVAGASDEMAKGLLENAPQLLEIAKAAQKLNPTLGDTAFLYESISTGIKRQSPLILDNLGIVISAGEAYENYAKSVGKSASELTKAEQGQAFLNATIEAGNNLIGQVGGNVDSATDAYEQIGTTITNTASEIKGAFAEAVAPFTGDIKEAVEELGPAFKELAEAAIPSVVAIAQALPDFITRIAHLNEELEKYRDLVEFFQAGVNFGHTPDTNPIASIVNDVNDLLAGDKLDLAGNRISELGDISAETAEETVASLRREAEAFDLLINKTGSVSIAIGKFAEEQAFARSEIDETSDAINEWANKADYLYKVSQDVGQVTDDIVITAQDMADAEDRQAEATKENEKAQRELEDALKKAAEAYKEALAASGDYFSQAIENQADPKYSFDLADALQKEADAAGASAEALAILGTITGEFTDEQAEAALKAAAIAAKIAEAGQDIANLGADITPGAIGAIVGEVKTFIKDIENQDFSTILNPEIEIEPTIKSDSQTQSEITQQMKKLFRVEDVQIGQPIEQELNVTANAEVGDATGAIGELQTDFDNLMSAFENYDPPSIQINTDDAIAALETITTMLDDIPRTVEVVVHVSADVDPEAEGYTT